MNVFDLAAKISLDSSEYERGLEKASSLTSSIGEKIGKGLKVAAGVSTAAIGGAAAGISVLAKNATDAGKNFESAFAQVQTIMDTTQMSTKDMSDGIMEMSNRMGVGTSELMNTVYNAISATSDTANALSYAETASKLAVAGFTDTSSALSVLTTAMNAYGLEADEVGNISDSLIQVQNLGVTTVAELSSSMGKAIASASAYGVDLYNLESAYISITKAGINTAEGTTYISSMMKELGDSSSDVSKILKKKTGKAFNELMADGSSLGDVLGVLYDSVNGDSTALMNLWGSAEAGKASAAIIGQGLEQFNENLEQVQGSIGATDTAFEIMDNTMARTAEKMKNSWTNLLAGMANGSDNLDGLIDDFAKNLEKTVKASIPAFTKALSGISKVVKKLAPIIRKELPPLIKDLAPTILSSATELFMAVVESLPALFRAIVDTLPQLFEQIKSVDWKGLGKSVLGKITDGIKNIGSRMNGFELNVGDIVKFIYSSEGKVNELTSRIGEMFSDVNFFEIAKGFVGSLHEAIERSIRVFAHLGYAIAELIFGEDSEFGEAVSSAWDLFTESLMGLNDRIFEVIEKNIIPTFKNIAEFVTGTLAPDLIKAWNDDIYPAIQAVMEYILDRWDNYVYPALSSFWSFVTETLAPALYGAWKETIYPAIKDVFDMISTTWTNVVEPVFNAIYQFVTETLAPALYTAWTETIYPAIEKVFSGIHTFWEETGKPALESFKTFVDEKVTPALTNLAATWKVLKDSYISPVVTFIKENVINAFSDLKTKMGEFITWLQEHFVEPWKDAFDAIGDKFKKTFEGFKNAAVKPINSVIGVINKAISGIESALNTVINGMNSISVTIPEWIPMVGGNHFGINIANVNWGRVPEVSWNAKAAQNPMLLKDATLFGGGETADEVVYGKNNLMSDIAEATGAAEQNKKLDRLIELLEEAFPQLIDGRDRNGINSNDFMDYIDSTLGKRVSLA